MKRVKCEFCGKSMPVEEEKYYRYLDGLILFCKKCGKRYDNDLSKFKTEERER